MAYKKEKIIEAIEQAIKEKRYLYKSDFINYSGKVERGKELYTEVVAEYLLKHLDFLNEINELKRKQSYKVIRIPGKRKNGSNRHEELFAIRLEEEEKYLEYLGKVIDFQVPLKPANSKEYKGVGKIDLLSLTKDGSKAYIIELKYGNNKDTLIKAILEIAYYVRWLWKEKFIKDYQDILPHFSADKIRMAVLLGIDTLAYREAKELDSRPNLNKLIKLWGVDIFLLDRVSKV